MRSMLQRMLQHSASRIVSGHCLNGGVRFFCASLLLVASIVPGANAVELGEITRLYKGGAAELALQLLDDNQPDYSQKKQQWLRWERMRVRILEQRGQWQQLAQRVAGLPKDLPLDFKRWADTRRARALVMNDQPEQARQLLRDLLWGDEKASSAELAKWRQLVMQSYLREGRVEDAYVAMLRYHQDYGQGDSDAVQMRARILLASKHPAEARSLLESMTRDRVANLLWWLARLRSGDEPTAVLQEIRDNKPEETTSAQVRYLYYGVMAEAALSAQKPTFTVIALEHWYRLQPTAQGGAELFVIDPDTLWKNYLAFAMQVGNAEQLLIGNDNAWLRLAEQTDKRYPVRKRSLYALLSQRGYSAKVREEASLKLAGMFQEQENGMAVVEQLFLRSGRYRNAAQLPTGVAYLLVDAAVRDGDLSMASQLLSALPEPPDNTAKFPWQLRRVKVFILAGKITQAVELLHQLIQAAPTYSETQRDQLIQLLFDLQTVGENEAAYQLLAQVYRLVPDLQLRRELLFWMADSRNAQEKYAAAARLYLQSATLIDVNSMDPWAQTARYNAAEALARGGMLSDAAHIYVQLLNVTKKADRRAVLRRGLEKVRMRQAANEK